MIEGANYTTQLMVDAILSRKNTQAGVAQTYAWALQRDDVNWKLVNEAIIARWSKSGLLRIKRLAWKPQPTDRSQ